MRIKFLDGCVDKYTREAYKKDQEKEFDDTRALEIIKTGYAVEIRVCEQSDEPIKLSELSKKELVALAKEYGLPHSGTKDEIISRILVWQEFSSLESN